MVAKKTTTKKRTVKRTVKRITKPKERSAASLARSAKRKVLNGKLAKTAGGLVKSDLKVNKRGRVVSKAKSDIAKKTMSKKMIIWGKIVAKYSEGKFKKGTPAYKRMKSAYRRVLAGEITLRELK
jgi:hypothetical protein